MLLQNNTEILFSLMVKLTFDTGETKPIQSKEDDFIKLFKDNPGTQANLKPKWIIKIIERNCTEMVDLTKFLINELFGKEIFEGVDKDKIFEKFKNSPSLLSLSTSIAKFLCASDALLANIL